jgi:hypothetical protein
VANTTAIVAAAAAAAQRRVIEQLRGKGATSHGGAAEFVPAQRGDERWLDRLLDRGVIVEAGAGRYWVNERTLRSRVSTKRVLAVVMLALLAALLGATMLGAGL